MAFPTGWPPRTASGVRSIRVFIAGIATANYSDNAYLFSQVTSANTFRATPVVQNGVQSVLGDLQTTGSPMGGGQSPVDVDFSKTPPAPDPTPMIWSMGIVIINNSGADLHFSFDGTNDHGVILAAETAPRIYYRRHEAGIALKGAGAFRVEAW